MTGKLFLLETKRTTESQRSQRQEIGRVPKHYEIVVSKWVKINIT